MALREAAAAWPRIASKELLVRGLLVLFLVQVLRFLYNGVAIRLKFRRLKAQGYLIYPHSLLLGHLGLVRKSAAGLPRDANAVYSTRALATDWATFFPHARTPPAIAYLDLWPIASAPIAVVRDPAVAAQLVAGRFPRRHEQAKNLSRAIAGVRNLFEWDGDEHRVWRALLNPGFSTRSLQAHVARGRMVDEAVVFAERMRASVGVDGGWGRPFQMFARAVDLTFDIICGVTLGFSPGEQTSGPTEMQQALRILGTEHLTFTSLLILHKQLNPFWHLQYYRCHQTVRRILLPHIQRAIDAQKAEEFDVKDSAAPKTVVELALKEIQQEGLSSKSREEFIEDVIGLTKQFIFAGHETTAITLSFAVYYLSRNGAALQKIRDEHDEVFGKDPSKVGELLRESPHLLGSLPWTTAAVKETLRLTAIAASIREGPPDFILSDPQTGAQHPSDGFILVSGVRNIHYDKTIFPRADEFLPQRWLASSPDDPLHTQREGHMWRPFELGPMGCIGQELAMMELKMALLFTAREFEFEAALEEWDLLHGRRKGPRPTVDGDTIYQSNVGPLGPPVEGMPMRVRLRSRS